MNCQYELVLSKRQLAEKMEQQVKIASKRPISFEEKPLAVKKIKQPGDKNQ